MTVIDIALEILVKYYDAKSCCINFWNINVPAEHQKLKEEVAELKKRLDECG